MAMIQGNTIGLDMSGENIEANNGSGVLCGAEETTIAGELPMPAT